MDWHPIETAPRDGTRVLCAWRPKDIDAWIIQPCACALYDVWGNAWLVVWDYDTEVFPTHWMPLPPPPTPADVTASAERREG